ncbi:hypothetical protein [Streptomyces tendae]|uniref:hypothetical protein n=1 Tax=Streptomyces tendae TaxID=1932 RepID=UPI0036D0126E
MGLRDSLVDAALARAARWEGRQDHRRALRAYRWADKHDRGVGLDVRIAATSGVHRVLREMHRQDGAAVTEAELDAARTAVTRTLLGRARVSRGSGRLAEAQRDFRAVIDERVTTLSAEAAHELAEMIDDARGNPGEERHPASPFGWDEPRRVPRRPVVPDARENLRALGFATESDALATAIGLCRGVLRQAEHGLPGRRPVSELLVQLLEDYGDAAGAAAARAHREIPSRLASAHTYGSMAAEAFAPYVIARLRPDEIVEHLEASQLLLLPPPSGQWSGYLILTDERLLFLEFSANGGYPDGQTSTYERLAVERGSVKSRSFSETGYEKTEWHFGFPPMSDGEVAHHEARAALWGDHAEPWRSTFPAVPAR